MEVYLLPKFDEEFVLYAGEDIFTHTEGSWFSNYFNPIKDYQSKLLIEMDVENDITINYGSQKIDFEEKNGFYKSAMDEDGATVVCYEIADKITRKHIEKAGINFLGFGLAAAIAPETLGLTLPITAYFGYNAYCHIEAANHTSTSMKDVNFTGNEHIGEISDIVLFADSEKQAYKLAIEKAKEYNLDLITQFYEKEL